MAAGFYSVLWPFGLSGLAAAADPVVKNTTTAAITAAYATTAPLGSVIPTAAILGSTGLTTAPLGSTGLTTAEITG
jgi:hypothetical protein